MIKRYYQFTVVIIGAMVLHFVATKGDLIQYYAAPWLSE